MGFMDFMKGKKSKGQAIVDAFEKKHGKNIEPFANKEEMEAAYANLESSARYHISTAFSNNTYGPTLKEEVEAFGKRMPMLKKKVYPLIAAALLSTVLSSCGTNMECLYCKEHNIDHDHYGDSYVEVSQGEPAWEDNVYVDPDLDWVGGNKYPATSEPSDDKGHDYGKKEDNDITIEDNDKVQEEDNAVGGNGAVVEGNKNETIVVNGDVYYIYNEYNQVINVGDVNNPQGLTQEQFNKLMEILKELGLGSKDEVSKDETSKDDESSTPEKDPEEEPEDNNQGSNGNQGNENVGDNGNQVAPEDMNAVDKFVCDYIQSKEPVKVTRMYAEKPVADGMTNTENIGKTVDVIFELSNNESVRISCEINVFNQFEKGQGFVYDRNKITSDNERIARIVKEMIELFENSYTA